MSLFYHSFLATCLSILSHNSRFEANKSVISHISSQFLRPPFWTAQVSARPICPGNCVVLQCCIRSKEHKILLVM